MNKFIASTTGGKNSGVPNTRDHCINWAKTTLANEKHETVYITEVMEVVQRSHPPIEVKTFVPHETLTPSVAKAA